MPSAGDEGYEKLVQCPYDKSHEIRKGRMQFHIEKCRKNFPLSVLVECPFNKGHLVPRQELEFHKEEECDSRDTWDRFCHQVDTVQCPVKDLVPVNAATVPDGDENWDNFEAKGSVLDHIKATAETKPIFRQLQCAPRAQRKNFRKNEQTRYMELKKTHEGNSGMSVTTPVPSETSQPKPLRQPSVSAVKHVSVVKQNPSEAVAAINKQFRNLDLNIRPTAGVTAPCDTSSVTSSALSEFEAASTSRQMPFSYAAASRGGPANRPPSTMSDYSSNTMMTALTSKNSRPSSVMSNTTTNSYATANQSGVADRPSSAMSNSSSSSIYHRPPNSVTYRQSTAMSIAASAAAYNQNASAEDAFCKTPIPGLGRGKRRLDQKNNSKPF